MERTIIQAHELENSLREQSSRKLPSDIKNDDIRECESISLNLEDDLSSLTLDKDKNTMEHDKMSLILEGELQILSLKDKQVEKKHSELIVENVLVGVKDFNFPIDSLTFGMEED